MQIGDQAADLIHHGILRRFLQEGLQRLNALLLDIQNNPKKYFKFSMF